MDEFKPEGDIRPDSSDRYPRQSVATGITVSRQHIMIGVGILVLLLIIVAIGSSLNPPKKYSALDAKQQRDIILPASSSLTTQSSAPTVRAETEQQNQNGPQVTQPVAESASQWAQKNQPTQFADAASPQKEGAGVQETAINLPTAPATLIGKTAAKTETLQPPKNQGNEKPGSQLAKPVKEKSKLPHTAHIGKVKPSASGQHYLLQLSGASRADTLYAFAKQQKLSNYTVHKTERNHSPWYILVVGNYASMAEAKQAVATLPPEVRKNNPWVRKVHHVQQEIKK